MAVFFCRGGVYTFCTPCHNDAMAGVHHVKSQCRGGEDCPLGIPQHPIASTDQKFSCFPMGCSLCRSEKLALISKNDEASIGVNNENRADMIQRFDHVKGHGLEREMDIQRGP